MDVDQAAETQHDDRHPIEVTVNTRPHPWNEPKISYQQVYDLAFPGQPLGDGDVATIEYSHGPHGHDSGSLTTGHSVGVKDGMIFSVYRTSRS